MMALIRMWWLPARSGRKVIIMLLLLLLAAVFYALQWPDWPSRLTQPQWSKALFDRQQQLLQLRLAADQQWRLPYQALTLPDRYQQALLLFEDQGFFHHPGVDPLAVLQAGWANIRTARLKRGASTLTMQLARLLLGSQPRTLRQKLREAGLALQLEWHYSKAQILQLYAHHAPYGGNIVGLTAASWWYFGRDPAQLSWSEAALLAVLPHSPGLMFPGRRQQQLQQKRDRLLHRLAQEGRLAPLDLQLALAEPLPLRPTGWPALAPHLLDSLSHQYPQQALFYTTLDAPLQQQMQQLLQRHARQLARGAVHNSALVLIDHQQMQLLAYQGNISSPASHSARSAPAVDIARSGRSTGSVLKPLLYALMLDEGFFTPQSLVADVPSQFGGYNPVNYDRQFRGAVTAASALAQSLNVPAVRALQQYGVARFLQQLPAFGLSSITQSADHYGLSLILGGAEASLLELTTSYARLSHLAGASGQAAAASITPLLQLLRPDACQLQPCTAPLPAGQPLPISQGSAYLTLQALLDVERPDTESSWREFANQQQISWKTGTSYGLRDGWAIGSNGRYTVGIWTGNADGSPAAMLTGGRSSGPLLFAALRLLPPSAPLVKPAAALQVLEVCASDGFLPKWQCPTQWQELPVAASLQPGVSYQRQYWLDASGRYQLPPDCQPALPRQRQTRLRLPLAMAYFYQPQHPDYQGEPPFWPGCERPSVGALSLLYPAPDSQLRLPLQLDGQLGAVVFRALHQDQRQTLYWHLDEKYLGATTAPHQLAVQASAGRYQLVITAQDGSRLSQAVEFSGAEPVQQRR